MMKRQYGEYRIIVLYMRVATKLTVVVCPSDSLASQIIHNNFIFQDKVCTSDPKSFFEFKESIYTNSLDSIRMEKKE